MLVNLPACRMHWEESPANSCAMFKKGGSWWHLDEFLSFIALSVYGPGDARYVQGSRFNDVRKCVI
jgi:hypothetical protein